jgi:hypothetical protein
MPTRRNLGAASLSILIRYGPPGPAQFCRRAGQAGARAEPGRKVVFRVTDSGPELKLPVTVTLNCGHCQPGCHSAWFLQDTQAASRVTVPRIGWPGQHEPCVMVVPARVPASISTMTHWPQACLGPGILTRDSASEPASLSGLCGRGWPRACGRSIQVSEASLRDNSPPAAPAGPASTVTGSSY